MFSFIRKFFERRKALAAERNRLCHDLLQRVSWALSDYIDASKTKETLQKWIDDKSKLLVELNDISEFKRSSYYKQLKLQRKIFDEFYAQAPNKIKASIPRELNRKIAKLAVNTDESILANDMCTCCGKDGKRKMLYSTEGEALIVAEHRSKETGIPLHVYPCPNGCGFHLTSNQE